jgi:DNA-binding NarL/FixJ family response regulator
VIRVALAEDQQLVRTGFAALVSAADDMEVTGEGADGLEAVGLAARAKPDVFMMDIRMQGLDGIEVIRRIADQPLAHRGARGRPDHVPAG